MTTPDVPLPVPRPFTARTVRRPASAEPATPDSRSPRFRAAPGDVVVGVRLEGGA
ncbi:hypothetical protein [Sphaerisporangium fuscum]|uniref:hypothetical protein n=1 Tax=Sphaerisporangium fuscum TaxID=2835868 RepID=UPI001BDCC8C0|nr:hypothetical protein [Sphaerisporangium fuscum]